MPREIITLQLGSLANYTGAHFWNLQVRIEASGYACSAVVVPIASALPVELRYVTLGVSNTPAPVKPVPLRPNSP